MGKNLKKTFAKTRKILQVEIPPFPIITIFITVRKYDTNIKTVCKLSRKIMIRTLTSYLYFEKINLKYIYSEKLRGP